MRPRYLRDNILSLGKRQKKGLWEFRGLTPDLRAGLVPAQCGATTRIARTPRNPGDQKKRQTHKVWRFGLLVPLNQYTATAFTTLLNIIIGERELIGEIFFG